jgi:integrase
MPSPDLAPTTAADAAASMLRDSDLSEQTVARLDVLMHQFASFVERGHQLGLLSQVTPALAERFIVAPTVDLASPGQSLQYFRRLAVRHLFRACRELNLDLGDPTIDVALPSRVRAAFRPLEDDEVELCRAASMSVASTRPSAAWALCEATARTAELAALTVGDVDLERRRVWLHGSARLDDRWGELTEWGQVQVRRHLNGLPKASETLLIDGGRPGSSIAQSSAVGVIGQTLRRAGLREDPAVRPSSIAAWAGGSLFDSTGRIDVVARRLGMRSLDRTAVFIGWDWLHDDR